MKIAITAMALGLAGFTVTAQAQRITGAGSSFVYPVLAKWSAAYSKDHQVQVNYQSIGSGGGIAQIKAATVDFGASDAPLKPADLDAAGLAQFPVIIGGIAPVINVKGIGPGKLKLDGKLLADIYLGKVKSWQDPEIKKLNPGLDLPKQAITVVHRSDGSGTTYNFANYLSQVSPQWKSKVGVGTSLSWPVGVGGKGNEGVAAYVQRIKGSIGYNEYAYVIQNKMSYALLENAAGEFMAPSVKAFQQAADSADWKDAKDFDLVMTNAPGKGAYPIAASTFVLMYKQPKNPTSSKAALGFFNWALEHGQKQAESLDYVPLPPKLVSQIDTYWKANIH